MKFKELSAKKTQFEQVGTQGYSSKSIFTESYQSNYGAYSAQIFINQNIKSAEESSRNTMTAVQNSEYGVDNHIDSVGENIDCPSSLLDIEAGATPSTQSFEPTETTVTVIGRVAVSKSEVDSEITNPTCCPDPSQSGPVDNFIEDEQKEHENDENVLSNNKPMCVKTHTSCVRKHTPMCAKTHTTEKKIYKKK